MSAAFTISSTEGSPSPTDCSRRWAPSSFWSTWLMWIGMRMVRDLSAIAREMAWRIHHVA